MQIRLRTPATAQLRMLLMWQTQACCSSQRTQLLTCLLPHHSGGAAR